MSKCCMPVTGRLVGALVGAFIVLMALMVTGCGAENSPPNENSENSESNATGGASAAGAALSNMAREGEALFNANCAVCHGVNASGTVQGPTLMDRIYHPGHHADGSIRNAVRQGTPQHHWEFGNMPPVAGVSPDDVEKIICYIRELQRAQGIFEGDAFSTVC